jgi:hypothetical protein
MFAAKNELFTRPSGGYTIARSVRFRSSASGYLNRTFATPTSSTIWTWSAWVKRGGLTGTYRLFGASTTTYLTFNSSDQLNLTLNGTSAATTTAVYRDPSSWYHIVYQQNGSAQTIYVNNVSVATGTTAASVFNTAIAHQLGAANTANYFDGYMTEVNFIDGQALTPSSFGATDATTGVWQPKQYTGTYGTNGFYLKFNSYATAAALGTDSSGNGNTWTVNNISVTAGTTYDSMTDVPTLTSATVANYCTLNPLQFVSYTITNGNLNVSASGGISAGTGGTISISSGKWYFEVTPTAMSASDTLAIGIRNIAGDAAAGGAWNGGVSGSYIFRSDGFKRNNGSSSSYGTSYTTSDVVGVALDMDVGTLTFYKNNTSQGTAYSGLSGTFQFSIATDQSSGTTSAAANFGQRPFSYTPPSGFVALNTYNLSTPTIPNGAAQMAATTYTGDGTANRVISGLNFTPDFIWIKNRSSTWDHILGNYLVTSGSGAPITLSSNSTAAQVDGGYIGAQTTDSLKLAVSAGENRTNGNTLTYVAWQWKANGAGVTNTSGSLTSTVSANTTAGLSIATYTGTNSICTVGHGLGVAPSFIVAKSRTAAGSNWVVYHVSLGNTKIMLLNLTNAASVNANGWNNLSPTSTVINFGAQDGVNGNCVAYSFAPIAGYSAIGSYTGNGSADGPFVFLGFRPRWIMIKNSDIVSQWFLYDTTRSPYNQVVLQLFANGADSEDSTGAIDILSNGFKLRGTGAQVNGSGNLLVYMAFAENPFKYSLSR